MLHSATGELALSGRRPGEVDANNAARILAART
jgi:hypothetical protein